MVSPYLLIVACVEALGKGSQRDKTEQREVQPFGLSWYRSLGVLVSGSGVLMTDSWQNTASFPFHSLSEKRASGDSVFVGRPCGGQDANQKPFSVTPASTDSVCVSINFDPSIRSEALNHPWLRNGTSALGAQVKAPLFRLDTDRGGRGGGGGRGVSASFLGSGERGRFLCETASFPSPPFVLSLPKNSSA